MPMEATTLALIYNKTKFKEAGIDPDKPPQNWDELYDYAVKLTKDKNGDGKTISTDFIFLLSRLQVL